MKYQQTHTFDEQAPLPQQPVPMLLWTGGWDSTFRLLQRVLIDKQPIQPIYFVNPDRESVREELKSILVFRLFQPSN